MAEMRWTEEEKAQLLKDAVTHIIPHFASNASLAKGPKVFARGEGCYVYDLDGKKYFDSFATLLTTVCGHNPTSCPVSCRSVSSLTAARKPVRPP
jgi:adenosylmethionine-8-amino-7-oxononanoate aminotransferase